MAMPLNPAPKLGITGIYWIMRIKILRAVKKSCVIFFHFVDDWDVPLIFAHDISYSNKIYDGLLWHTTFLLLSPLRARLGGGAIMLWYIEILVKFSLVSDVFL